MDKAAFPGQCQYSSLIPVEYQCEPDEFVYNRLLRLLWKLEICQCYYGYERF